MAKEIGIDLGNSNIFVSAVGEGIVSREPAVIAIDRASGRLLDYGRNAESRLASDQTNTMLYRPFRDGLLSQCEITQYLISSCIRASCGQAQCQRVMLSVPCSLTDEEEGALVELAAQAGALNCSLVYTPIAALIGADGAMSGATIIADIGAAFTNIMLITDGEIVSMQTLKVGGNSFDDAIVKYVEDTYRIKMSRRTAENVKKKIGTVWSADSGKYIDIKGRGINDDFVRVIRISSDEMFTALEEPTAAILEALCVIISKIPSEYIGSAFSRGIILSGGGSLLDGLDRMVAGVTGVKAGIIANPLGSTALGMSKILGGLSETKRAMHANISRMYIKNFR